MNDKETKELADKLARIACEFFQFKYNPETKQSRDRLATWMLPELEKMKLVEDRKGKEAKKNIFNRDKYEEVCPHHVPCVVCNNPVYRKKR